MTLEQFKEKFDLLPPSEKIAMFIEFSRETDCKDAIYEFDDDMMDLYSYNQSYGVEHGSVNLYHPYVWYDYQGCLESLTEGEAESVAIKYAEELYKYPNIWQKYIETM